MSWRLPAGLRLGPVRLQVADLQRSVRWYQQVLGLHVRGGDQHSARLTPADSAGVLVELHGRPGAAPVPPMGRLGLYHYALLLPDRPALGRFLRHTLGLGLRAGTADHLVSEALYLQDPDGLGIEVYADRPRELWRYHAGQLVMTTEPLDAKGLLAEAGAQAWPGLPSGTAVGHLHLHVGDLAQAEAFYHRALGFDRMVWSYPGALFLAAGGYHHHLGLNTWARAAPPPRAEDARLLEWEIVLPAARDVAEALASVREAGFDTETSAAGALLQDPWGTRLRLRDDGAG